MKFLFDLRKSPPVGKYTWQFVYRTDLNCQKDEIEAQQFKH